MKNMETRKLICKLTDDDRLKLSLEQTDLHTLRSELEFKVSRLKSQIKPLTERIEEIFCTLHKGEEERPVECRWMYDYDGGKKSLLRLDTYDEVENDIIREYERQQHLFETGRVTPGGFTETDEKAQKLTQKISDAFCPASNEVGKQEDLCPKCAGDGYYIEDGIEDGGGEVYCDCSAGVTRKDRDDLCNKSRGCQHEEACFLQPLSDNMICYVDEPDQLPTAGGCPHPEEARFVESNATICGACGLVMATAPIERESQPDGEVTA